MVSLPYGHGATAFRSAAFLSVGGLVGANLLEAAETSWGRLRALPARPAADLATTLTDVATLTGLVGWTWLLLAALITVLATLHVPSHRRLQGAARSLAPPAARRALLGLLGLGTFVIPAGAFPATAARLDPNPAVASAGVRWGQLHSRAPAVIVQGLPLPDRPAGRLSTQRTRPATRPDTVVVAPGDTLWAIAARSLRPNASTTAIAGAWPRWYAANRSVIGADPDLIIPGTVLRPPTQRPSLPPDERP